MIRTGVFVLAGILLLPLFSSTSFADADDEIWKKLSAGGLVVLMRHASVKTGSGNGDSLVRDPSCTKERNLSTKGMAEAAHIGDTFKSRGVPVEDVLTSPFCRTTDTGKIAFDRAKPTAFLSLLQIMSDDQSDDATAQLSSVIGSYAGSGNLVLITHAPNINAVAFEPVGKGMFLVIQPTGDDTFEELGLVNIVNN